MVGQGAMSEKEPLPQSPEPWSHGRTIDEWHKHLTSDDLDTPGSRYGHTASGCAWWALAAFIVYDKLTDEADAEDKAEMLTEYFMAQAVNDNDGIHMMVTDNFELVPHVIRNELRLEGGNE